jgi:hypothetical protein
MRVYLLAIEHRPEAVDEVLRIARPSLDRNRLLPEASLKSVLS